MLNSSPTQFGGGAWGPARGSDPSTAAMATTDAPAAASKDSWAGGELLFCGGTDWSMVSPEQSAAWRLCMGVA